MKSPAETESQHPVSPFEGFADRLREVAQLVEDGFLLIAWLDQEPDQSVIEQHGIASRRELVGRRFGALGRVLAMEALIGVDQGMRFFERVRSSLARSE